VDGLLFRDTPSVVNACVLENYRTVHNMLARAEFQSGATGFQEGEVPHLIPEGGGDAGDGWEGFGEYDTPAGIDPESWFKDPFQSTPAPVEVVDNRPPIFRGDERPLYAAWYKRHNIAARLEAKTSRYRHGHAYRHAANIPDWVQSSGQLSAFYLHANQQKAFLQTYHADLARARARAAEKTDDEEAAEAVEVAKWEQSQVVPTHHDVVTWEFVPDPPAEQQAEWFFSTRRRLAPKGVDPFLYGLSPRWYTANGDLRTLDIATRDPNEKISWDYIGLWRTLRALLKDTDPRTDKGNVEFCRDEGEYFLFLWKYIPGVHEKGKKGLLTRGEVDDLIKTQGRHISVTPRRDHWSPFYPPTAGTARNEALKALLLSMDRKYKEYLFLHFPGFWKNLCVPKNTDDGRYSHFWKLIKDVPYGRCLNRCAELEFFLRPDWTATRHSIRTRGQNPAPPRLRTLWEELTAIGDHYFGIPGVLHAARRKGATLDEFTKSLPPPTTENEWYEAHYSFKELIEDKAAQVNAWLDLAGELWGGGVFDRDTSLPPSLQEPGVTARLFGFDPMDQPELDSFLTRLEKASAKPRKKGRTDTPPPKPKKVRPKPRGAEEAGKDDFLTDEERSEAIKIL